MKINLLSDNYKDTTLSPLEVVFLNRGFKKEDIYNFIHSTDKEINSPLLLGRQNMELGLKVLFSCITQNKKAIIIVDCDVDGYTSAALLGNYLFRLVPQWTQTKLQFFIHEKKIHGLSDSYLELAESDIDLIICPDSASSDYKEIEALYNKGKQVLVIDHHESDNVPQYGVIINNQLSDYPNKALSGVGVVWQFCRFLDSQLGYDIANDFLDLVALGLIADVMSLASIETKHLISKGLNNIKNPFLYYLVDRNSFSLGSELTPFGISFYIAPYLNAMARTGTKEEQTVVFNALLEFKTYQEVLSTKRGHKLGEMETILQQALRLVTNVKNRQNKMQETGQELIEKKIEDEQLLNKHKILMILLNNNELSSGLAGLVANKLMSKYQRPVCILTKQGNVYTGSARNYDRNGFTNFKDLCEETGLTIFQAGHQGAFGLGIEEDKVEEFLTLTDQRLGEMKNESSYNCDFAFDILDLREDVIASIADNEKLWGKNLEKPLFFIKHIKVTKDLLWLMKADTLKIKTLIPIIQFKAKETYEALYSEYGAVEINIVAEAVANDWQGERNYQLKLIDYEIIDQIKYVF